MPEVRKLLKCRNLYRVAPGTLDAILFSMRLCRVTLAVYLSILTMGSSLSPFCGDLAGFSRDCQQASAASNCVCPGASQGQAALATPANFSCCQVSQAPPRESAIAVTAPDAGLEPLPAKQPLVATAPKQDWPTAFPSLHSPPDFQPLHCIFLI